MGAGVVPEGFEAVAREGLRAWAVRGFAEPAIAATAPEAGAGARGRVRFLPLPGGAAGERMAVRHYHRGGILAPILRDFHLDPERPLREIELYLAARAAGVPTLEPLAGVSRHAIGPLWRCDLVTRAIAGAHDLGELFADLRRGAPRRRARVIEAVARAVRALHDAGFRHRDLNLKNILVAEAEGAAPRALVIDLDGTRRRSAGLGDGERRAQLMRLYRSSQKIARRGESPSATDLVRFAIAYAGDDEGAGRALAASRLPRLRLRRMLWAATG